MAFGTFWDWMIGLCNSLHYLHLSASASEQAKDPDLEDAGPAAPKFWKDPWTVWQGIPDIPRKSQGRKRDRMAELFVSGLLATCQVQLPTHVLA